jgi:hypothetical protein
VKRLIITLAGLMLTAGQAGAQEAPPAPPRPAVISGVQWESRPTLRADDYPAIPLVFEMEAAVTVRCTAQSDGLPVNCEAPGDDGGLGFNDAAIRVVQRGRLDPMTVNGVAENATFTTRISFRLGLTESPPAYAGEEPSPEFLASVRTMVEERFVAGQVIETMIGGLTPQDRARVEIHFVRALRDKGDLWLDAVALAMARTAPPEVIAAFEAGLPPPLVASPGRRDFSALDRLTDAERQIRARAREYFCAQHSCPDED